MDNIYDYSTESKVSAYSGNTLGVMIGIFSLLGLMSIFYVILYMFDSMNMSKYTLLKQDDEDTDMFSADRGQFLKKNQPDPNKWGRIIEEYMAANIVWGLMTYNLMLILIYTSRYITHIDHNYMRETDVFIVSIVLSLMLKLTAMLDFFLFKNPSSGSVFMHYFIFAVFSLNFTMDFHSQVGYCEIFTLGVFFAAVFLFVYKIKIYIDIGVSAGKKIV